MLNKLGNILRKTTDRIANAVFLDKNLVDQIVRDLQRALIEADVNIVLVKQLSEKIKKEALNERIKGIEKKEHLIKLLHDELVSILGEKKELEISKKTKKQNRIMFVGLYGSGKTTTIAKLGNYFSKRGSKTGLVGLDVHRPAAKEQLKQMADKAKVNCLTDDKEKNPIKIWKKLEKNKKLQEYETLLIDTAGRHSLDKELVKEIKDLKKEIQPTEIILVIPADIGQSAKTQAQEFQKNLDISGVIITRMDSTAKAGGALTACSETNAGVYFITTGEKIQDIETFDPESFLSRLLGMGDLKTLMDKIQSVTDSKQQEKIQSRLQEGKLTLEDVVEQVKSMNQLGGFGKIKDMIPGFGKVQDKLPEDKLTTQEDKIKKWEHIIKSMTQEEKENPEILEKQTPRIRRISKGAGVNTSDVRGLIKQYKMLKEMASSMSDLQNIDPNQSLNNKQMQKLMKKFGKRKLMKFK
ncbi:MAG: signal recognition particle receptor subunit alpha [Nanoarchaeota archaeon]